MAKKTMSNSFTVNIVEDGESTPYYFQEWYAWSNDSTTASVTTPPTISGSWQTSIPAQGNKAYLWRKSIRHVWNESTRTYTDEAAQYFRMSGTDGTSIRTKGSVDYQNSSQGSGTALDLISNPADGDAYVVGLDLDGNQGWLYQWAAENNSWIPLGQFKGENGKTYFTHIAWATNVNTATTPITVTGFVITKSPNDTTHLWMGVYIDENSGQDPSNAALYTWSYTKGVDGTSPIFVDTDNEMDSVACDSSGKTTSAQYITGNASIWQGNTKKTMSSMSCQVNGKTLSSAFNTDGYNFNYSVNTGAYSIGVNTNVSISKTIAVITIQALIDGVTITRTLDITINGVKAGESGSPATIYKLVPSVNQIVKKKDDSYIPSADTYITCTVTKNVGGTSSTPSASEYSLKYKLNGGTETTYTSTSIKASQVTSNVQFILYDKASTPNKIDVETIPLVSDGNDGTFTTLVPNPSTVNFAWGNGAYTPSSIRLQCGFVITRGGNSTSYVGSVNDYTTLYNELQYRAYVRTKRSDGTYGNWVAWGISTIALNPQSTTTNLGYEFVLSTATDTSSVSDSNIVTRVVVPIVKSGEKGNMSRNIYFAGLWSDLTNNTFEATDHKAPYVRVGGTDENPLCYSYIGANGTGIAYPASQAAYQSSSDWEIMYGDFKYLITQAIFAAFAKLGSWIFNGDYMFSQTGVDGTQNYEDFEGESGAWQPNLYMNALTGRIVANDIVLRGVLNNMINTISNSTDLAKYGTYETSTKYYYLNPLKVGQYLSISSSVMTSGATLVLPVLHNNGGTSFISGGFTLQEMRQMVGKQIHILVPARALYILADSDNDAVRLLIERKTYYNNQQDLMNIGTSEAYIQFKYVPYYKKQVNPAVKYVYKLTCKAGYYNSYECIYWEIEVLGNAW